VEQPFRDIKTTFETQPIFHRRDEAIRNHVFCSFLAIVLRKRLIGRLDQAANSFERTDIKQHVKAVLETVIQ